MEQIQPGKALLHETVALSIGLTRSIAPDRLGEEALAYGAAAEIQRREQD